MTIEAQKIDLASRLLAINNQVALDLIEQAMQEAEVIPVEAEPAVPTLKLEDAIVEIREGVTLEEIMAEQNYKPTAKYEDIRKIADSIEWEHSLEELLEVLD